MTVALVALGAAAERGGAVLGLGSDDAETPTVSAAESCQHFNNCRAWPRPNMSIYCQIFSEESVNIQHQYLVTIESIFWVNLTRAPPVAR